MLKLIGMVFLVAISLTSECQGLSVAGLRKALEIAERAEVAEMVEAVFKNYDYLDDCHDMLSWSMNVTACEQFMGDLLDLKDFLFAAVEDALAIADEAEALKAEFTTCSTESILKEIKCYESVISAAKSLGKEVKTDEEEFIQDGEAIVQQMEVDSTNCFEKGLSSEVFEAKMRQCNLKLKAKSN